MCHQEPIIEHNINPVKNSKSIKDFGFWKLTNNPHTAEVKTAINTHL